MYLTITSTAPNATDLGFLLHKHPDRAQQFDVGVGTAHVFYPEAAPDRCTAALLLEIDPIGLVRGKRFGGDAFSLAQYVNDRPYAASSMLAVALGRVFRSALAGRCAPRPELPGAPLPLQIRVPAVPSSGGADLVHRLFAPLGWQVGTAVEPLDPAIPAWGDSRYIHLQLTGVITVADALSHLYVLLPVLDDAKHYWVGDDEIDKLVRVGGDGWPATRSGTSSPAGTYDTAAPWWAPRSGGWPRWTTVRTQRWTTPSPRTRRTTVTSRLRPGRPGSPTCGSAPCWTD